MDRQEVEEGHLGVEVAINMETLNPMAMKLNNNWNNAQVDSDVFTCTRKMAADQNIQRLKKTLQISSSSFPSIKKAWV